MGIVLCLGYGDVGGQCGKKNLLHCEDSAVNFSYRTAPPTPPPQYPNEHRPAQ